MLLQARSLAEFYSNPQGVLVRQALLPHLRWMLCQTDDYAAPDPAGACLGYGFVQPYLDGLADCIGPTTAMIPHAMGRLDGGGDGKNVSEECLLPFGEAVFETVILIHSLEGTESARTLLRQIWRVLTPEGRLILVVPNRSSLWAVAEVSPFACGRPYRRSELAALLRDTLFEPFLFRRALYAPPRKMSKTVLYPALWDKLGGWLFPTLCGVHIAAAKKSLYGITPLPDRQKSRSVLVTAGNL